MRAAQQSGSSATHEEYREAREIKPVLVFVESGIERGARQQAFLDQVEAGPPDNFGRHSPILGS